MILSQFVIRLLVYVTAVLSHVMFQISDKILLLVLNDSLVECNRRCVRDHFVPSVIGHWPIELKFAILFILDQRYVFTKLEVSTACPFRDKED